MPADKKKKKKVSKNKSSSSMFVKVKSDDDLEQFMKSGGESNFLSLKDQDEVNVSFLKLPKNFINLRQHNINDEKGKFKASTPCIGEDECVVCEIHGYDTRPVSYAPVYVFERDKMMLFRCSPTVQKDMIKKARRNPKRWKNTIWVVSREGSGFDTVYSLDNTGRKVGDIEYEEIDEHKLFMDQYNRFVDNNVDLKKDDDDDEEDDMWSTKKKKKKKSNKSNKSKR